jgi:hypothetical protein
MHRTAAAVYLRKFRLSGHSADLWALRDHCLASKEGGKLAPGGIFALASAEILAGNNPAALETLGDQSLSLSDSIEFSTIRAELLRGTGGTGGNIPGIWLHRGCVEFLRSGDSGKLERILARFPLTAPDWVNTADHIIEHLLLYWRVKWFDDMAKLSPALEKAFPPLSKHPVYNLLMADTLAELGFADGAERRLKTAENCSVLYIFPKRWEDGVLLGRALRKHSPGADSLRLLKALHDIENGFPEKGVAELKQLPPENWKGARLVCDALAKWESAGRLSFLRTAFKSGAFDRRLLTQLCAALRQAGDLTERETLLRDVPGALRDRGDMSFPLACLLLDRGDAGAALEIFCSRRFNQHEGVSGVRREYADAALLHGLKLLNDGEADAADKAFSKVLEFPENIGAASYLGKHDRLALFMKSVIAGQKGDSGAAQKLRERVFEGSAAGGYSVAGLKSSRGLRADELAAEHFAALNMGRQETCLEIRKNIQDAETAGQQSERDPALRCLKLLLDGRDKEAFETASRAAAGSPCDSVLKIMAALCMALRAGRLVHSAPV